MTQTTTINPMSMTIPEAARLLSAAGRSVTTGMLEAAVAAGVPVEADGRINLVNLMAWLEKHLETRS